MLATSSVSLLTAPHSEQVLDIARVYPAHLAGIDAEHRRP